MTYQLGHTSTSTATNDSNGDGTVAVTGGIVASRSGTLVGGSAYVALLTGSGVRSQKVRMVLYADAAGVPGAVLGVTDEVTVSNATSLPNYVRFPTWTNFGVPPKVVAGTTYWIGLWWGTVVNAANVEIGAVVAAGHVFFNGAETYSSSGNPPNSPTTDSGFAVDYDAYFDVNDGPPLHLPGRSSRKSRLVARSRPRPDAHISRSRVAPVVAAPAFRNRVVVKPTLKARLAARLRIRPDVHVLRARAVPTPTPLVRNRVKVTHEAITRATRYVRREHKDVYWLRGSRVKPFAKGPIVKATRKARTVGRLVHKQPRILHGPVGTPALVVRARVVYERVTPRVGRLVRSHRVKAKSLRNPFVAPLAPFVRAKIIVTRAAPRRPQLRRLRRPRLVHAASLTSYVRSRVIVHTARRLPFRRPKRLRFARNPVAQPATPPVRNRVVIVRQRAKIARFVGHSRRFKLRLTRSHGGAPPAPFPYAPLPTLLSGPVPDEGRGGDPDISGWISS